MARTLLVCLLVLFAGCGKKKAYSVASLLDLLKDKDPKMRYYAARELGHFGAQAGEVVPALTEALKDEDKDVRMRAASSLGEIGPEARPAIPALEGALKDPDPGVRKAADQAMKTLRDPSPPGKEQPRPGKRKRKDISRPKG
jgi:HEAT repeat protein